MSYRTWPAGLLTAAALTTACVVVGEHVARTGDGCLGSQHFIATPAVWPSGPITSSLDAKLVPAKVGMARATAGSLDESSSAPPTDLRITGCLDVDRIEIPAPTPVTDGRA